MECCLAKFSNGTIVMLCRVQRCNVKFCDVKKLLCCWVGLSIVKLRKVMELE